jgi:hypothetical protein
MLFERDDCKFEIPDRPTVRQQMMYIGKTSGGADGLYPLRFWDGARALITEWKCEKFPNKDADLDSVDDPVIADILLWAGLQVWTHISSLEELPKN